MEFRTMYSERKRVYACHGDRMKPLYRPVLDDNGHLDLVEDGFDNLYERIQSHKDSCDIHVILDRFSRGDVSVLERRQGVFADVTDFPTTYAELLQRVIDGENVFRSLPVEVRARFGHSFHTWMASFDKPDFAEKMGWQTPAHVDENVVVDPAVDLASSAE